LSLPRKAKFTRRKTLFDKILGTEKYPKHASLLNKKWYTENSIVLGCDTVSVGVLFPTFERTIVSSNGQELRGLSRK